MRLRWLAVVMIGIGACFTPPNERCLEPGLECPGAPGCDGCLQASGVCLPAASMSRSACAAPREACQACAPGSECVPGRGCFATGTGGQAGSGTGGSACSGCVVGDRCLTLEQTSQMSCGRNGRTCTPCNMTEFCNAGACTSLPGAGGSSACTGCLSGATCIPEEATSAAACGQFGATCVTCPPNSRCSQGFCQPLGGVGGGGAGGFGGFGFGGSGGTVDGGCSGCFAGNRCVPAPFSLSDRDFCGLAGIQCVSCDGGSVCASGRCVRGGMGGADGGGMGGAGGGSTCSGCITASGMCVPDVIAATLSTACGRGGSMCRDCRAMGEVCQQGGCARPGTGGSGGSGGSAGAGGTGGCAGCVSGPLCVPPQISASSTAACGLNGATCSSCRAGQVCSAGACRTFEVDAGVSTDGGCASQTRNSNVILSVNLEAAFNNPFGAVGTGVATSAVVSGGTSQALRLTGFATAAPQVTLVVRGSFVGPPPLIRHRWGGNGWQPRTGDPFTGVYETTTAPTSLSLEIAFLAPNGATTINVDDVALRLSDGTLVRPTLASAQPATSSWVAPFSARTLDMQTTSPFSFSGLSEQLTLTNWGFTVPSTARVTGVTVNVTRRGGRLSLPVDTAQDARMTLWLLGAAVGANRAQPTPWGAIMGGNPGVPGPFTTAVYGGSTDLWGANLTPVLVNESEFGLGYSIRDTDFSGIGGVGTPEIDVITMRIDWCN